MKAVETNELVKHYQRGQIKALNGVSLSVERGKVFSLLGPNGAGKTTLIKLLLGIVFPTSGNASLLGEDVSNVMIHERIGYLAENHRFPDFLTANQILYYFGKMAGVSKSDLNVRIPKLLKRVNLQDWGDTRIRKYSKGMMQRVGIAQALMNEPDLLFLDEPTDGIDPVGRREIRELLQSLRDEGKTIFLNSHLLSEVERISDEVAILKHGKLVRQGSVEELISVKQQFEMQIEGEDLALRILCKELDVSMQEIKGKTVISVEDDAQLNHIIDMLREQQIVIQGIIPRKISLEDFFIDVIEDKPQPEEVPA